MLENVKGVGKVEFTKKDIVRHHLVQRIVEAYERWDADHKDSDGKAAVPRTFLGSDTEEGFA